MIEYVLDPSFSIPRHIRDSVSELRVLIMVYIALVLMVKQILVQFDVLLFHLPPTFSGERKLIAG